MDKITLSPPFVFFILDILTKPNVCKTHSSAILTGTFLSYPNPNGYLIRLGYQKEKWGNVTCARASSKFVPERVPNLITH